MITIPRYLRPHSFSVFIPQKEDAKGVKQKVEVVVDVVKIDNSYGLKQSQKGIGKADKVQILVDLTDFVAFDKESKGVSFEKSGIVVGNRITIKGIKYMITSVVEIGPFSDAPCYVEVYAND